MQDTQHATITAPKFRQYNNHTNETTYYTTADAICGVDAIYDTSYVHLTKQHNNTLSIYTNNSYAIDDRSRHTHKVTLCYNQYSTC